MKIGLTLTEAHEWIMKQEVRTMYRVVPESENTNKVIEERR